MINPFNIESVIYKYIVRIDKVGKNKKLLGPALSELCGVSEKDANVIVDKMIDDSLFLANTYVCSFDSLDEAKIIKQKLEKTGSKVSILKPISYDVKLKSFGRNKLAVVKTLKDITKSSLYDVNELVKSVPRSVVSFKTVSSYSDAIAIKQELEGVGAEVIISVEEYDLCGENVEENNVKEFCEEELDDAPFINLNEIFGGTKYYCVLDGKSFGPITVRQLANMVRFNIVDKKTLVWKEGMDNWAAASTIAELTVIV